MNVKSMVLFGTAAVFGCATAWAQPYDGISPGNNGGLLAMQNNLEVGNEIFINPANSWNLDQFTIEYDNLQTLTADVGIQVSFYLNNGPVDGTGHPTPGPSFFTSGFTSLAALGGTSAGLHDINYTLSDFTAGWNQLNQPAYLLTPGNFTFTVTFTGLDVNNQISLPLGNNQATAYSQSFGDYWVNNVGSGGWALEAQSTPANFLASFTGSVPEPSTFGLAAIGGAVLMGINRLRRKS